jgi:hypothetical protein
VNADYAKSASDPIVVVIPTNSTEPTRLRCECNRHKKTEKPKRLASQTAVEFVPSTMLMVALSTNGHVAFVGG